MSVCAVCVFEREGRKERGGECVLYCMCVFESKGGRDGGREGGRERKRKEMKRYLYTADIS